MVVEPESMLTMRSSSMDIVVNEELKAYIDPLTPEEYEALERSILAEGCRDALVLWGDVLVDGHNRYGICQKHGLPFQTVQNTRFKSMDDVHLWMIDQHLGRRSMSDFQRGVLALRKKDIVDQQRSRTVAEPTAAPTDPNDPPFDVDAPATPTPAPAAASPAEQPRSHCPRRAPEQQPGRHDREDPEAGRARTGGGREVGRDLDQHRRRRGLAAGGRAGHRRQRRQGRAEAGRQAGARFEEEAA
jgi:hypothetical protein